MLTTWILALMVLLQPSAPWRADYEEVAKGIEEGARVVPIFAGEQGLYRTVALDVSLAWYESRFDRHAVGDHGAAHGLFQVHATEASTVAEQVKQANALIKQSLRVCAARPFEERLGWYASGGPTCDRPGGLKASKHRMNTAVWLLRQNKPEGGPV